jgi:hypothetical protein
LKKRSQGLFSAPQQDSLSNKRRSAPPFIWAIDTGLQHSLSYGMWEKRQKILLLRWWPMTGATKGSDIFSQGE